MISRLQACLGHHRQREQQVQRQQSINLGDSRNRKKAGMVGAGGGERGVEKERERGVRWGQKDGQSPDHIGA